MTSPQTDNGFLRIATGDEQNDVFAALARCRLSGIEFQIVLWVIRQTWGYGKKEDWISLTQFEKVTGATRSYVCRAIERLVTYRILVTQKSPGKTVYGFNKRFGEWVVTQTTPVTPKSLEVVTPTSAASDVQDNQVVTPTSHTKETPTKEKLQKKVPEKDKQCYDIEEIEKQIRGIAEREGWADTHYLDKLWSQHRDLRPADRDTFYRKISMAIRSARHTATLGFARKVYFEAAGLVNDRGLMEKQLSADEAARRREFANAQLEA